MAAAPVGHAVPVWRPPIRIRTLLAAGFALWAASWLSARVIGAFRLQRLASDFADYAVCMVGPTGAGLLRDNALEFRRLVRRRLVSAAPGERPFARCARLALAVSGSSAVARAHAENAAHFSEYALERGSVSLDNLAIDAHVLVTAARQASPFVRGFTALVKPSFGAVEAIHPVEPARPALGRGLPPWRGQYRSVEASSSGFSLDFGRGAHRAFYRSADGLAWTRSAPRDTAPERCAAEKDHAFALGFAAERGTVTVSSFEGSALQHSADLVPAADTVYSVACDDSALLALVHPEGSAQSSLYRCAFGAGCGPLSGPRLQEFPGLFDATLDVARVRGTSVLAVSTRGLVRVTSSRDEGRTWTPLVVAFDSAEFPDLSALRPPSQLLVIEDRVYLYAGGARANEPYPVLVSGDFGASFRTPANRN